MSIIRTTNGIVRTGDDVKVCTNCNFVILVNEQLGYDTVDNDVSYHFDKSVCVKNLSLIVDALTTDDSVVCSRIAALENRVASQELDILKYKVEINALREVVKSLPSNTDVGNKLQYEKDNLIKLVIEAAKQNTVQAAKNTLSHADFSENGEF